MKRKTKKLVPPFLLTLSLLLSSCGAPPVGESPEGSEEPPAEDIKTEASLLDYSSYAAGGNWAVALERAFKDADIIYVPEGTYPAGEIRVPSGKTVYGDGEKTVFKALAGRLFVLEGTAGGEIPLGADMESFSNTLTLSGSHRIKEGDLIYLLSQRNSLILEDTGFEWCLGRSYENGPLVYFAEFLTVASADGNTLTTRENTIYPGYLSSGEKESAPLKPTTAAGLAGWPFKRSGATVQRVIPIENVTLKDFTVIQNGGSAIYMLWARNCAADRVTMLTPESEAVIPKSTSFCIISRSLDCVIRNSSCIIRGNIDFSDSSATFEDYASYNMFYLSGCQNCGFDGCYSNLSTHAFVVVGSQKSGVSTGCYVKNCSAENAKWSGIYAAQGCYDITVTGNTVTASQQGIKLGSRKNYVADNYIDLSVLSMNYFYVRTSEGGAAGIALIEGYSIDTVIENNTVNNAYTAFLIRDGYESTNIFEKGKIIIRNNTSSGCKQGLYIWKNKANSAIQSLNLLLEGNSFTSGDFTAAVYGLRLCPRSFGVSVAGCTFDGFRYGVYAESFSGGLTIKDSVFKNGVYGILAQEPGAAEKENPLNLGLTTDITVDNVVFDNITYSYEGVSQPQVNLTVK